MRDGFIKVAAATSNIKVADTDFNAEKIQRAISEAVENGAKVIVFPEMCITGYTVSDLLLQERLLKSAREAVLRVASFTKKTDALIFVGFPFEYRNKLYNVAAALYKGKVIALIPKRNIPNYNEFYEARHFTPGPEKPVLIDLGEDKVPFGTKIQIRNTSEACDFSVAAEICEDVWVPCPPSSGHAMNGAELIVNLSASNELIGKKEYRRLMLSALSRRLISGYVYSSAGEGESTQDVLYGGDNLIAENGRILSQAEPFKNGIIYGEIDVNKLKAERRRTNTFTVLEDEGYITVDIALSPEETSLSYKPDRFPFVPDDEDQRFERCNEVLNIQAMGLKQRLKHIGAKTAVVGISGGLDSTLALLVTVRAFDSLNLKRSGIKAVTMPCFGTTDRTYNNAVSLIKALKCDFREVDIKKSVLQHFEDIGQDYEKKDVTFENAQARERTQVLMDIANMENGIVIGTGDLSELALGWATYNGDHMSMYAVNAGVPKTLVRHLVRFIADTEKEKKLSKVLLDILDTPVSPELLPPKDGVISQETEDLVGPYELHDYFLYYMLRFGFPPKKILRLALLTFEGIYDKKTILKWLKVFYKRFFSQQFKRSCLPDGPKVGTVAVSPRGDLRMPSDASGEIWLKELGQI